MFCSGLSGFLFVRFFFSTSFAAPTFTPERERLSRAAGGERELGPGLAWRAGAGGGWPRVRARWAGGSGGVSVTHAPESRGREASRLSPRWAAQDSWLVRLHGKPISH